MSRYIPLEDRSLQDIQKDLESEIARWRYLFAHGCSDPFWADGTNLNLVRNHIIHDIYLIREKLSDQHERQKTEEQMSLFGSESDAEEIVIPEIPPILPETYMVPTGKHAHRLDNRWMGEPLVFSLPEGLEASIYV